MMETRINLIGASGSGTSAVGRSLASALSLPHFESDDYFHTPSDPPFQQPRSADERCRLILRDLSPGTSWILSGGIVGWTPAPDLDFTCIVFLYVPTPIRIQRLRQRELERFGNRILQGGDMAKIHEEFIRWASRYDEGDIEGKTLATHEAYLRAQTCPVLEFREVLTVSMITKAVLEFLGASGEDA
jgi:adenylate kinase family enzyme